ASITAQTVTGGKGDGTTPLTLSPTEISDIELAFKIAAEAGNTNNGAIDWTYQITDNKLDFLAAGEKVTLVSTVLVDDHHGGTDPAIVPTTTPATDGGRVMAAADKPEPGPPTELPTPPGSSALPPNPAASGTIHFTDVDLTDRPTASITAQTV